MPLAYLALGLAFLALAFMQAGEKHWWIAAGWALGGVCMMAATVQTWRRTQTRTPLSDDARREVLRLLGDGRQIEAIKRLRTETGASLVMAVSPTFSAHSPGDLALTASFFLVLLGWTPSLISSLLGHAAGWLLLASLSGAAWMIWLLSVV